MKKLLLVASFALVAACAADNPTVLPTNGEVWIDPIFRAELREASTDYAAAVSDAVPLLASPVCLRVEAAKPDEPLCRDEPPCADALSEEVAAGLFDRRNGVDPGVRKDLYEAIAASLRHSEAYLVPGLDYGDWQTILREACDESPVAAAVARDERLADGFVSLVGQRTARCDLDYSIAVMASEDLWRARASRELSGASACFGE